MIKQREVLVYGDRRLRERAEDVADPAECADLIARMRRVMEEHEGAGLAANQIGDARRVIVWNITESSGALINPVLTPGGEEEAGPEGCLSVPGMAGEVVRATQVTAEGLDENGARVTIRAEGMLARVLQHEVDHLDGVLFVDRVTRGTLKPVPLNQVVGI
jgi:peptide deformylase